MKSRLAESCRQDLIEDARKMTPNERLRAFAEHSKWVAAFAAVGRRVREAAARAK